MDVLNIESDTNLSLLSLLVKERLEASLQTPEGQRRASRLKGTVAFKVDGMHCNLTFSSGTLRLDQRETLKADVKISGSLAAFVALCRSRAKLLSVLRQQMTLRGNPLLIMKLLPLLQLHELDVSSRS